MHKDKIKLIKTYNYNTLELITILTEARIRGYPIMEECPYYLKEREHYSRWMAKIIDWLVGNYPDEFGV